MVAFFGRRWDAPMLDGDAHQVPTPVGQPCGWCGEPVAAGDQGLLRTRLALDPAGGRCATVRPVHTECDLREAVGSPAHLQGRCSCHGEAERQWPGTARAQALATLALMNQARGAQGLGPL